VVNFFKAVEMLSEKLSGAFNIDQAISQPESLEVPLLAANVQ
jgi:hypothetical protein